MLGWYCTEQLQICKHTWLSFTAVYPSSKLPNQAPGISSSWALSAFRHGYHQDQKWQSWLTPLWSNKMHFPPIAQFPEPNCQIHICEKCPPLPWKYQTDSFQSHLVSWSSWNNGPKSLLSSKPLGSGPTKGVNCYCIFLPLANLILFSAWKPTHATCFQKKKKRNWFEMYTKKKFNKINWVKLLSRGI